MPRVVHFEISADDPDLVLQFYQEVFGWKVEKWEGPIDYWLITTGEKEEPGINGGLLRPTKNPIPTVNSIDVPSVDEFVEKITQNGGKVTVAKMSIPGIGYLAYFQDPEGTTWGIIEHDTSAQ